MKCLACCAAHTFCQFRYRSAPFSVPCLHLLVRLQLLVGPRALDGAPQFSLLEWQGVRCALGPSRLAAVAYVGEHSGPHPCASGYQSVAGDPDAACPSADNPAIRVKFPILHPGALSTRGQRCLDIPTTVPITWPQPSKRDQMAGAFRPLTDHRADAPRKCSGRA